MDVFDRAGDALAKKPPIDQEHYDSSSYFEGENASHLTDLRSSFQQYRIGKVTEIRPPNYDDRVVDLGCGWGTFCFALADQVREVIGIDFSAKSIELCEERLASSGQKNVRFVRADASDTGLPSASFSLVIAADLFEHLYPEDSKSVAAEAFRILAPGGHFVAWTPHRGHFIEIMKNNNFILEKDVTHVDYKSMADMRNLLGSVGFMIEKAYYAESHLPGLRILEKYLHSFIPPLRRRIAVLATKSGA